MADRFRGGARCLRDMRCTASLPEICGPAPALSRDGSCSKLLRSQLCSPTRVLVWHRDHTRRSYKMASGMPGFELCVGLEIFAASVLFSAKSTLRNQTTGRRSILRMPGIFRRSCGNLQLLRRLLPESSCLVMPSLGHGRGSWDRVQCQNQSLER